MRPLRRILGISVVELLVVAAVLGILLSLLTVFFSSQVSITNRTQARNEVEISMRTAAEIMIQDLQMAGSRSVAADDGSVVYVQQLQDYCSVFEGTTEPCIDATGDTGLPRDVATIYYATSLRSGADRCRRVDYRLTDDGQLLRSDVACTPAADPTVYEPFADHIIDLTLSFTCSDDDVQSVAGSCYADDAFPQQATVTIRGSSENTRERAEAEVSLSTTLHNLRPVPVSE